MDYICINLSPKGYIII